MVEIAALLLFILGFILISFERSFKTSKSAIALTIGGLLWLIVALSGKSRTFIEHIFSQTSNEIFGIIMFLLASMALVELMSEHHLFDAIRNKLLSLDIDIKKQFLLLSFASFFLSAGLDNMTVGLVMIQVARHFFKGENMLIAAAGVVIGANAGGSWSPIGDVTTVLLWLSGKYGSFTIIREGFFPALAFMIVSISLLVRQLSTEKKHLLEPMEKLIITLRDKIIIGAAAFSFVLPILANAIGLPAYIGLLLGLGLVWIFLQFSHENNQDPMSAIFKRLDLASINFYTGILLAANALYALGVLETISKLIFGQTQAFFRVVWGAITAGFVFSIFDNIPLTALSLKLIHLPQESLWVLLALTIGNGGSIMLIGSAAGIAVMSGVPDLTVSKYFKIAFVPTFLAYIAMVAVWLMQYNLFLKLN